ncbi:MAG: hypothetical protein JWO05_254 [Gemmatimonadetes bacterium]|nr:hypothetical protein [Gemmatimonadota bacterium]
MRAPRPDADAPVAPTHVDRLGALASPVIAALTEGIVVLDAQGIVLAVNLAGEQILGAPASMMVGAPLVELPWTAFDIHGARVPRESHPIMLALTSGDEQGERLLRYPRPDGDTRWISTSARPLRDATGALAGAVASFRDVSMHLSAQTLLRESEEQYRALFERNGAVQLITDAATERILSVNPAALSFYGFSREKLEGAHVSLLNGLAPASSTPLMNEIVAGRLTMVRRRHILASGESREVEMFTTPLHVGGRTVIHSIITDISPRLEAEAAQARLAAILDATPDIVGMFDPSGRLFYANQAGRRAMGLPDSPDAEIPADAIQRGHSSEDAALVLVKATAVARREGTWRGETTLLNADGTSRVMSQTVIAHHDQAGEVSHFSSILHDVSEMRKTEELLREQAEELEHQSEELAHQAEELLEARDAAESANHTKSRFLAQMSHELRTPLTAIIGFSRVLESNREAHLSEKEVLYASRISTNALRLLTLINDLLDLSKVESGHMEMEWSEVDVAALATEVVADMDARARTTGVELLLRADPSARRLRADEQKLRQVLLNLVGNALKFTAQGSVTVSLHLDADGRPVALDVDDTGLGIDAANLLSVFEPFAQEDESISRRFGGTGLGLAISRQLCEMMGFTIELTSTLGKGSRFRVRFDA